MKYVCTFSIGSYVKGSVYPDIPADLKGRNLFVQIADPKTQEDIK